MSWQIIYLDKLLYAEEWNKNVRIITLVSNAYSARCSILVFLTVKVNGKLKYTNCHIKFFPVVLICPNLVAVDTVQCWTHLSVLISLYVLADSSFWFQLSNNTFTSSWACWTWRNWKSHVSGFDSLKYSFKNFTVYQLLYINLRKEARPFPLLSIVFLAIFRIFLSGQQTLERFSDRLCMKHSF